jgi:RNA polymerase-interacting CarD/CdnL/TRCF family regulator
MKKKKKSLLEKLPEAKHKVRVPEVEFDSTSLRAIENHYYEVGPDLDFICATYEAKPPEAKRHLMLDIILEHCQDPKNPPNTYKVKQRILKKFMQISGVGQRPTYTIYDSCASQIKKVTNVGLLQNYGAAVLTDVIERLYSDIEDDEEMKPFTRLSYYKTLLDAANSLQEIGLKQVANDINWEKNTIMNKKVDADAKLGTMDVALRIKDMARDDKERAALDALFGDKTLLNPIFDQICDETEVIEGVWTQTSKE